MKLIFKNISEGYTRANKDFLDYMKPDVLDDVTQFSFLSNICSSPEDYASSVRFELVEFLLRYSHEGDDIMSEILTDAGYEFNSDEDSSPDLISRQIELVIQHHKDELGDVFEKFINECNYKSVDLTLNENWYANLSEQAVEAFRKRIQDGHVHDGDGSTKNYMRLIRPTLLPATTWLVHYTNQAESIAVHGFKYGAPDKQDLALTRMKNSNARTETSGYNFAFLASHQEDVSNGEFYGKQCVVFQSSGTMTHHRTDNEHQIVFDGSHVNPKSIYPIYQIDMKWCVLNHNTSKILFKNKDINVVVKWVIQNHRQYHKMIRPT